jgi:desulfoferrodoxin (superoxide reductase-like protein)
MTTTDPRTPSIAVELVPRRIFCSGLGAVAATFVVSGCAPAEEAKAPSSDATPPPAEPTATSAAPAAETDKSSVVANSAWENEAKSLEGMGQGLYTAKDTKDQAGKEGSHVPKVMLAGDKVSLSTTHATEAPSEKKPKGHHITHHYLRDGATGLIFAWKTFDLKPGETAASEFTLPAGVTSFTAYQVCNLHWTWASESQAKA